MNNPEPTTSSLPRQFYTQAAANLFRLANLAAYPFWEGAELRFTTALDPEEEPSGVRVAAYDRRHPDRLLAERTFTTEELRDGPGLGRTVEAWVEGLPVQL